MQPYIVATIDFDPETINITGMIVTIASSKGRKIRLNRWTSSGRKPRFFQSIAVKNPLTKKNSGILHP